MPLKWRVKQAFPSCSLYLNLLSLYESCGSVLHGYQSSPPTFSRVRAVGNLLPETFLAWLRKAIQWVCSLYIELLLSKAITSSSLFALE
jgi:hypothetical protein